MRMATSIGADEPEIAAAVQGSNFHANFWHVGYPCEIGVRLEWHLLKIFRMTVLPDLFT